MVEISLCKLCSFVPLHVLVLVVLHLVIPATSDINDTQLPSFPAILVFGDSTVDPGNNNYIVTIHKAKHYPYGIDFPGGVATGRFSNGLLSTDMLASALKIKNLTVPPFLDPNLSDGDIVSGVSFASAGSGYDLTTNLGSSIPVKKQILLFDRYLVRLQRIVGEGEAKRIVGNAVVFISAGAVDFLLNYYANPARKLLLSVGAYQDRLQHNMNRIVEKLYARGCRNVALSGLPPMGCIPVQMAFQLKGKKCLENQNADARLYNKKLQNMINDMERLYPDMKIAYANIYDPLYDMIKNPLDYGFEETKVGCCGYGLLDNGFLCNVASPLCSDSSKYIFFDALHPSQAAYYHLTQYLLRNSLPRFL